MRRIDLVFIGPNPTNISGMSAKFWRAEDEPGRPGVARVTWGKIGTHGQSQIAPESEIRNRAHQKLRKGYVHADDATVKATPPPAPRTSMAERIAAAVFEAISFDRLVGAIARRSLVETLTTPEGVRLYADPAGCIFAACRYPDGMFGFASIGAISG